MTVSQSTQRKRHYRSGFSQSTSRLFWWGKYCNWKLSSDCKFASTQTRSRLLKILLIQHALFCNSSVAKHYNYHSTVVYGNRMNVLYLTTNKYFDLKHFQRWYPGPNMDTIHFILDVSGYRSEIYMSNDFSPIRECSTEVINDVLRTNI